ncbi:hypothetical protein [Flavicella sp.]|uniref:hypothetical protein n=1 Tax=Flavicella sp. TaxID=2957742 RepID=UPI003019186A
MNLKIAQSIFIASFKTIGYLFLLIISVLFLDSYIFTASIPNPQIIANIAMFTAFTVVYWKSTARIRELMIYAVLIGFIGEYLFSLGLGMYTYRLGNVPWYVPPGHAIVYIATIYFCKQSIIKNFKKQIEKIFTLFVWSYCLIFLIFKGDVFGFLMSIAVLSVLKNKPRERLFYLTMYVVVAFLEIVGTAYQCWYWPDTAFGVIPFLKSSNPPSGISLVYFLLDLGSLWLYKLRHRTAWSRMKLQRALVSKSTSLM